jgi:fructokinase
MIVVCGEALMDVFVAHRADRLDTELVPGGSAFNTARVLAALGQPVSLLAGLSSDRFGLYLRNLLTREGVDLAHAVSRDQRTTLAIVQQDQSGGHSFSFYGDGADLHVGIPDLPDRFPDAVTSLVMGSYALVTPPIGQALAHLLTREYEARLISIDLNYRPSIVGPLAQWQAQFYHALAHAHIVKASLEDLQLAFGPDVDPAVIARQWIGHSAALVLVTLGAEGALAFYQGQVLTAKGQSVEVVDTVGAGDAFHAAFLGWFHARNRLSLAALPAWSAEDIAQAMAYAVTVSARLCKVRGACVAVLDGCAPLTIHDSLAVC